jgi:MFS family permease
MLRGVAAPHVSLLRRSPSFRLLFAAAAGSGIGTRLAVIALVVDVYDRTGSGKWVGALLIADFLPTIAIGLLLGSLVDRLSRRRLMIASDLGRFAIFCLLPFAGSAAAVVALAAGVGFANGFFRPAVYAGLPNLVSDDDLPRANGLFQAVENVTWMLGPLLGGALLTVSGPDLAYWINAGTFLVSAALIIRIPAQLLQSEEALSAGHLRDLAEGLALARRSRALLTVLIAWSAVMLGNANVDVAEVKLAKVAFDAGNFGLGLLMAGAGLGLVLGSIFAGSLTERRPIAIVYAGSILLMALGIAGAAVAPSVWPATICVIGFGIGNGIALVANVLLIQRGAPDRLRGRAFTLSMSVTYTALFLGMIVGGALTDAIGARWTWGVAAMITAVASVLAFVLARGIHAEAAVAEQPVEVPTPVVVSAIQTGEAAD